MKLEDLNKNKKNKIPEGYFESLPDQVLNKITKEEKKSSVIQLNYYWSVAVSIAILIASAFLSNIFDTPKNHDNQKTSVKTEEFNYYEYVDLYISDFEAIELLEEDQDSEINEYLLEESEVEQIIELL